MTNLEILRKLTEKLGFLDSTPEARKLRMSIVDDFKRKFETAKDQPATTLQLENALNARIVKVKIMIEERLSKKQSLSMEEND